MITLLIRPIPNDGSCIIRNIVFITGTQVAIQTEVTLQPDYTYVVCTCDGGKSRIAEIAIVSLSQRTDVRSLRRISILVTLH